MPFVKMPFTNPSDAANDERVAKWTFPKETRVTNTGLYIGMKSTTNVDLCTRHPHDFIDKGRVLSHRRVPSGTLVILWAHGLAWLAVDRRGYILCGKKPASGAGRLIDLVSKNITFSENVRFLAGIVLAPIDIFLLEAGTFEVELTVYGK